MTEAKPRGLRAFKAMTYGEYRANIAGLNIFFGAVLGFVMAGTESLESWDFALVLLFTAGMVTTILYIPASPQRILYAFLAVVLAWLLPTILQTMVSADAVIPTKLQPTLLIWAVMMIVIEFVPRGSPEPTHIAEPGAVDG